MNVGIYLKDPPDFQYTEEQVLKAIEEAFWDGVSQGEYDDAGERFEAKDYLPNNNA
jgi:hypothetical protein